MSFNGALHFAKQYLAALKGTPQTFRRMAFRKRTLEEELQEALLRGSLRKAFGGFDLLLLGLGIVIGSGWAQLSGSAAEDYAGASVIVSYMISGFAILLAAACYAELCLEYPVSGGSFSYVMATFGELAAFITLAGLLLEYMLGMAAEARSFSRYLARLANQEPTFFRLGGHIDLLAAGLILFMTLLLCLGVRESALFISSVTVLKLVMLVFISIVGYTKGNLDNMSPFFHPTYDVDGCFLGAAHILFAYTGFDAIGSTAEEVRNVAHMPMALLGTIGVAVVVYVMLALALVLMACPNAAFPNPYLFCPSLTFITAFIGNNMKWMQYVVSVTALLGILTALTVGMFSASRTVMVASRDWLLPPFLARISPRTQTPVTAQAVAGLITALLAMLVEMTQATSLVSFGALVALWFVCNAQLYRRYFPDVQLRFTSYGTVEAATVKVDSRVPGSRLPVHKRKVLVWVHILAVNAACIALAAYYHGTANVPEVLPSESGVQDLASCQTLSAPLGLGTCPSSIAAPPPPPAPQGHWGLGPFWFALAWLLVTLSFQLWCPLEYEPAGWHVPWWLMPWLPSVAIGLICFSVGSLPNNDYYKIGAYFGATLLAYVVMALPLSYIKHSRSDVVSTEELTVVELSFKNGEWQPTRQVSTPMSLVLGQQGPEGSAPASARSVDIRREVSSASTDGIVSLGLSRGESSRAAVSSGGTPTMSAGKTRRLGQPHLAFSPRGSGRMKTSLQLMTMHEADET